MSWGGNRMLGRLQLFVPNEPLSPAVGDDAAPNDDQVERASHATISSFKGSELNLLDSDYKAKHGLNGPRSHSVPPSYDIKCQAWLTKKKLSEISTTPVKESSVKLVDYSSSASKSQSLASGRTPIRSENTVEPSVLQSIENVRKRLGYVGKASPVISTDPGHSCSSSANPKPASSSVNIPFQLSPNPVGDTSQSVSEKRSNNNEPDVEPPTIVPNPSSNTPPNRMINIKQEKSSSKVSKTNKETEKSKQKSSKCVPISEKSHKPSASPLVFESDNVDLSLDERTIGLGSAQVEVESAASASNRKKRKKSLENLSASKKRKEPTPKPESSRQLRSRTSTPKKSVEPESDDSAGSCNSDFDFHADFSDDSYHPSDKEVESGMSEGSVCNAHLSMRDGEDSSEGIEFAVNNENDDEGETGSIIGDPAVDLTRKSKKSNSEAVRASRKFKRNTGQTYRTASGKIVEARIPKIPTCKHKGNAFECQVFDKDTVSALHSEYWLFGDTNKRVQYMANRMELSSTERRRSRKAVKNRMQTIKYYIEVHGVKHRVCKEAIMNIFSETDRFLREVAAKKGNTLSGCPSNDMRGKSKSSRKSLNEVTVSAVKSHIEAFPAYVSHYCRKTSSQRYLASYLTVRKMHKRYLEEGNPKVSYTSYRRIFKTMGLKFKEPKSDTCAKCDSFDISIKGSTGEEREAFMKQKELHLRKAEKAYELKREKIKEAGQDPTKVTIIFDLEQCLPVPDLPTGKVYYARQLYVYNLTVVHGKKTFCYMWAEHEARRGANEIASCLYQHITEEVPEGVTQLTMFSDCCSGQNRNSIICSMLLAALQARHPSLETIDHIFLTPGHTRMECDSRHSVIERFKKQSEQRAMVPGDWYNIVKEAGNGLFEVFQMEGHFYDFQKLLEAKHDGPLIKRGTDVNKVEFRYLETCWFRYQKTNKGIVEVKSSYNKDVPFRQVDFLRRGRKISHIRRKLTLVESTYNPISSKKKEDLRGLFGLLESKYHIFYNNLRTDASMDDEDPDLNPETEVDIDCEGE